MKAPANTPPADEAYSATMVFDPVHNQVVLFGVFASTWTWDGTNWTHQHPANSPPWRGGAAMVYDTARRQVVLFGGGGGAHLNDTWVWDGTNWTQKSPVDSPPARSGHAMAYDAARRQVVLFGGEGTGSAGRVFYDDTWVWDGTNWVQANPANHPPFTIFANAVYDAAREQVVLFGGLRLQPHQDTWVWDGTNWSQKNPVDSPPWRYASGLAYDTDLNQVVLFGGAGVDGGLDDTWIWDGTNWTQQSPANSPPPRFAHAMAYDAARREMVLFGGRVIYATTYGGLLNDTWVWHGDAVSPPARTFLVTFTGWGNSPPACSSISATPSDCVIYPDGLEQNGLGMVNVIANAVRATQDSVIAKAFTFYTFGEGNDGSAPPDASVNHPEAYDWLINQMAFIPGKDRLIIAGHSYGGHRARLFAEEIYSKSLANGGTPIIAEHLILVDAVDWNECTISRTIGVNLPRLIAKGHRDPICDLSDNPMTTTVPIRANGAIAFRQIGSFISGYSLTGYTDQPLTDTSHTTIDDREEVQREIVNRTQPASVNNPGIRLNLVAKAQSPTTYSAFLELELTNGGQLIATDISCSVTTTRYIPVDCGSAFNALESGGLILQPGEVRRVVVQMSVPQQLLRDKVVTVTVSANGRTESISGLFFAGSRP